VPGLEGKDDPEPDPDTTERRLSLKFGNFKFLDMGDLTWNYEKQLVCPANPDRHVDLFQTRITAWTGRIRRSSSGRFSSRGDMNNGPRKEVRRRFSTSCGSLRHTGHLAGTPRHGHAQGINTDEKMIANLTTSAECKGNLIKVSVASNGKYTVTNARNGYTKTYSPK